MSSIEFARIGANVVIDRPTSASDLSPRRLFEFLAFFEGGWLPLSFSFPEQADVALIVLFFDYFLIVLVLRPLICDDGRHVGCWLRDREAPLIWALMPPFSMA